MSTPEFPVHTGPCVGDYGQECGLRGCREMKARRAATETPPVPPEVTQAMQTIREWMLANLTLSDKDEVRVVATVKYHQTKETTWADT